MDWFSHGGSRRLEDDESLGRGIAAVGTEIGAAVAQADRPPVLMGHSMGGLASLACAPSRTGAISALVLPDVGHGITFDPSWSDVRDRIEGCAGGVTVR